MIWSVEKINTCPLHDFAQKRKSLFAIVSALSYLNKQTLEKFDPYLTDRIIMTGYLLYLFVSLAKIIMVSSHIDQQNIETTGQ